VSLVFNKGLTEKETFEKLKRLVYNGTVNCEYYLESYLKRRFAVRMRTTNIKTYSDYQLFGIH
jgi:chemotaxis methyl-accepting protein methylase